MRRLPCLVFALAAGIAAPVRGDTTAARPARPIPAIERVLVISIDGLRPDRLLLADAPVLRALAKGGAYTFWAQTTAVSTTLPSHTSMLTGVSPRKHRVEWNDDLHLPIPIYPAVPTVFELAKKWGYVTALVSGKTKFNTLTKPGTVDFASVPTGKDMETDEPVCDEAVRILTQHKPELLFVHFPADDKAGHSYGWGSPEQMAAIARVDACVGRLLAALEQAGVKASTLIIVTADHGGAGKTHGPDDPRSRHIPWIASGPGVRTGCDLTQNADLVVRTEDTTATVCHVLGLGQFPHFDGKPVLDAFLNPPQN